MGKDSALYQLMGVRMNGVMNGNVSSDGEYQSIIRKSARLPAWVFRLQSYVFGEMSANRSKRNEHRTVTEKSQTGRKGFMAALPPYLFRLNEYS